ncbi:MAG: alkylmercury lyase family protein [Proteobacteria bacterium]|nr:alkylmercury lyase family protein [Pseudomonadota bacterium]
MESISPPGANNSIFLFMAAIITQLTSMAWTKHNSQYHRHFFTIHIFNTDPENASKLSIGPGVFPWDISKFFLPGQGSENLQKIRAADITPHREETMNPKIDQALDRLNAVLPLKANQDSCQPDIKQLHQTLLHSFVNQGRILTRDEMASQTDNVEAAIAILTEKDMAVFSHDGEPVGAYPFTMEQREHKVRINGHTVHAMCALDALSIAPMFNRKAQIYSVCRVTQTPVSIQMAGNRIENPETAGSICFGILWGAANGCSCCANSLCTEMMFLTDRAVAEEWLSQDPENRQVFDLEEAIEFGARFFTPLMS